MLVGTTLELERQRLDPGDVYEGWTALDLPVLVPGHQSTVDGAPLAGIGVQVHDVAAQNVVERRPRLRRLHRGCRTGRS
jgi:hypothetical protein